MTVPSSGDVQIPIENVALTVTAAPLEPATGCSVEVSEPIMRDAVTLVMVTVPVVVAFVPPHVPAGAALLVSRM